MSKKLRKALPELIDAGIISEETAEKIRIHLATKEDKSPTSLVVIFGILGAILAGLGILLIIAHNWDEYSRAVKTVFAFIPLVAGHIACAYTLFKKPESTAWREGSSTFLFLAIGACISLISQIYHIPGNITSLLLTWVLLGLPLVYIMRSSMASILYIIGITYYGCYFGYNFYNSPENYNYWFLFILVIPHYIMIYRNKSRSNFTLFHHWFIPLSVVIMLGSLAKNYGVLMYVAYLTLFNLCYLLGKYVFSGVKRDISRGYFVIGFLGTIIILIISSFRWFWEELGDENLSWNEIISTPEMLTVFLLFIASVVILVLKNRKFDLKKSDPIDWVFLVYIVIFILGNQWITFPLIIINILVFVIGVYVIWQGAVNDNLPVLNYGLLVLTALIISRFFDSNLSFVLKGTLFMLVGAGFFTANILMIKRRKKKAGK